MLFNSVHFYIFAPIVIAIFFLLRNRAQRAWLLIISLYFYAVFKVPWILLLIVSILVTHYAARGIAAANSARWKRICLWIAIIGNASILYFFKFIDFSFQVVNWALGLESCDTYYLHPTGSILPMGISFFALQAIAYAVDVYRGTIEPTRRLHQFALFLSFFPQLVAGPIMRARDLLDQFAEEHRFRLADFRAGIGQVALGFFKKTFIADPCGVIVDMVFASPGEYSWWAIVLSSFLHAMQIYGDFSGYSDIAIGIGRIMGFRIPMNFRRPFYADTMTELWNRWHISLSRWLRDYIYIPLGGNRVSVPRTYFNIFVTMAASGVWHGSGLNFIIWGVIHALFVVFEKFAFSFERVQRLWQAIPLLFRIGYSYFIFSITLLWFRAKPLESYGGAADVAGVLAGRVVQFASGSGIAIPVSVGFAIFVLMAIEFLQERESGWIDRFKENDILYYTVALIIVAYCGLVYAITESVPFVYFQF